MCSVGGPPDVDFNMDEVKRYKCKECGNDFKGMGKKPVCPTCSSEDVESKD